MFAKNREERLTALILGLKRPMLAGILNRTAGRQAGAICVLI